jgi:hypothetical protein
MNETTVDTAEQNANGAQNDVTPNSPNSDQTTTNPEDQGTNESATTPVTVDSADATEDEVPLTGLKDGLKQIYRVLK